MCYAVVQQLNQNYYFNFYQIIIDVFNLAFCSIIIITYIFTIASLNI